MSKKKKKNKVPYGSEMARNAIESEFRTSKMADQSEMARNAIQSDFEFTRLVCVSNKIVRDELVKMTIRRVFWGPPAAP